MPAPVLSRLIRQRRLPKWVLPIAMWIAAASLMLLIKWYPVVREWASAVSISALVFTIIQMRQSGLIADSMSTKYVGIFPENIPAIVDVINAASSKLSIIADTTGYGHFSDPLNFGRYRGAINRRIAEGVDVTLTVYDETQFQEANRTQLKNMTNTFENFVQSSTFETYAKWAPRRAKQMQTSAAAFFDGLLENERRFVAEFRGFGARLLRTAQHIPLYAWIADDRYAVFCFVVRERGAGLEYAFETRDGYLIKGLLTMFKGYQQDGSESLEEPPLIVMPHPADRDPQTDSAQTAMVKTR